MTTFTPDSPPAEIEMRGRILLSVFRVLVAAVIPGIALAQAGGALGNGISARATALGGTTVAAADGPLESMAIVRSAKAAGAS